MLSAIYSLIVCLIEYTGYYLILHLCYSFEFKRNYIKNLIIVGPIWLCAFISSNSILVAIAPMLCIVLSFFVLQEKSFINYISMCLLAICICDCLDAIISVIFCLQADYESYLNILHETQLVLPKLITLVIISVFTILYRHHTSINALSSLSLTKNQILYLILGVICFDILISAIIAQSYTYNDYKGFIIRISIIVLYITYGLLLYCTVSLRLKNIQFKYNEFNYQNLLKSQQQYFDNIVQKNVEPPKLRHDLKAHLTSLYAIAQESNNTDMINYLNEMIEPLSNASVAYTGNFVLDSIINELTSIMDQNNISFEFNGLLHPRNEIIIFDICSLIYNSLQNAIEGCELLKQQTKTIIFEAETDNSTQKIRLHVYNTCVYNKDIYDITTLPTTKTDSDNHGIGMKNIRDIVLKYNGYVSFYIESGWFHVKIVL